MQGKYYSYFSYPYFNHHVDVIDDSGARRFVEPLDSIGLDQHIRVHPRSRITRNSDQLIISPPWANYLFSDHMPVNCNIQIEKPALQ
mgnify:CR=1 FL=1